METYQLALKISKELEMEHYNGIIYQNIGSLYSCYQSTEAINFYKKSLTYKKGTNEQLITIFSIVVEYAKSEYWNEMKHWIDQGFYNLNHRLDAKHDYIYHFSIYKELCLHKSLSEKVVLPAIKFFKRIQDYRHCYKYSYMLGESLYKQAKYKAAASYYQDSQAYLLSALKIKCLGDF